MPVRFTSPSLGASSGTALNDGQWQFGLVYRYLYADHFYVGHDYHPEKAPAAMPVRIAVNTAQLNLTYAASNRLVLNAAVPIISGMETRAQGDNQLHTRRAAGLGDVSLVGTMWLGSQPDHPFGNAAFGLGIKAPTGKPARRGSFALANGTLTERTLDPSIQTGDGGWGIIAQTEAFRHLFHRLAVYGGATYLSNPRAHNSGTFVFGPAYKGLIAPLAATDEYSAHAGITYTAWPRRGLTASIGGRVDGVPVHDVLGRGDDSFRRPGYAVYVEPGVAFAFGRSPLSPAGSTISLSVPLIVDRNRMPSMIDRAYGQQGGGDFAKFVILLGLARRL